MSPRTRRAFLQASGLALGGLLAGCVSDDADGTARPSDTVTETSTPTQTTEQFPPPEPTSAAPQNPKPMPTATDWPRFQADAGNTGHVPDLTAVPDDPEVDWDFFVQSSPPVVADGTRTFGR